MRKLIIDQTARTYNSIADKLERILYVNIELSSDLLEEVTKLSKANQINCKQDELDYYKSEINKTCKDFTLLDRDNLEVENNQNEIEALMELNLNFNHNVINPMYNLISREVKLEDNTKSL